MTADETVAQLNRLIEACRDGELGYAEAARLVEEPRLREVFEKYARERAGFARELREEVQRLGGKPAESGTLGGALHRGWIDLKATATLGESKGLLNACHTGEDAAYDRYHHAAGSAISGKTRALVEKQWASLKDALSRLEHLKREIEAEEASEG